MSHDQKISIDVNGHFPLSVEKDKQGHSVIRVDLGNSTPNIDDRSGHLINYMHELLELEVDGYRSRTQQTLDDAQFHKCIDLPLPENAKGKIILNMNGQTIASFTIEQPGNRMVPASSHNLQQLAVSETRSYGGFLSREPGFGPFEKLPYLRGNRFGFDPKKHAPITDVHTHLSAQIKGKDLIDVAFDVDQKNNPPICYPAELLDLLGVAPKKGDSRIIKMPGRGFTPLRDDGLDCEVEGKQCDGIRIKDLTKAERDAIIHKMGLGPDVTMASGDFDREMYRYRNPLIKHPDLAKPIIKKIAKDYADMGIEYAELSTGSMTNPSWFRSMVEALNDIENNGVGPEHKKVTMRFLVGLPRNISPQETIIALERIKYLARHPYIVGVDLLGYESNKTSDFHWALSHMADWARASEGTELNPADGWDFKRDFVIRVHAGETAKNPTNVSDAVKIAGKYGVRLRLGHALYSKLDAKAQQVMEDLKGQADPKLDMPGQNKSADMIASERCMDSNQVFRIKMMMHHQPAMLDCPGFLGSDGGGAIDTGPVQLAYSAMAAGWSLPDLANLRKYEHGYIQRQHAREKMKTHAFEKFYGGKGEGLNHFLKGYEEHMAHIPDPRRNPKQLLEYLPPSFRKRDGSDKNLVLIGGASGSTWKELENMDQQSVKRIARAVIAAFDPEKTCFMFGRATKESEGGKNSVTNIFDEAIKAHNLEHPQHKFATLTRYAGAAQFPTGELAETITWIQDIPEGKDHVPISMVNYTQRKGGKALFFPGSEFTAQMAYCAADQRVPFALFEPKAGRLAEVCENSPTESKFNSLENFIDDVLTKTGPNCFFKTEQERGDYLRDGIDLEKIKQESRLSLVEKIGERGQGRTKD